MIVNMSDTATPEQIEHVIQRIREAGKPASSLTSPAEPSAPSLPPSAVADAVMRLRRFPSPLA